MTLYEALIDPADFGLIADYLRAPNSGIDYILHVRDRSMLSDLAERLTQSNQLGSEAVTKLIERLLSEGALLISARSPTVLSNPRWLVESSHIPRSAPCEVLFVPPFYLAHTPGLFEGEVVRSKIALQAVHCDHQKLRRVRLKL